MNLKYIIIIFTTFFINNIKAYTYYSDVGMFYKAYNDKTAWYDAVKICEAEGASLAMPRNRAEVDVLLSLIANQYIMIGFHSLFNVQKFTTINGEDLQYYYNIWDAKQPDDGVGHCGYISSAGKLHDGKCKQNYPFICEKPTSSRKIPTSDPNCQVNDSEYRYASGIEKCYKIHMNPETFLVAEKMCRGEGGHLAIIRNLQEETFLSKMFKEPKYSGNNARWPNNAYIGVHEKLELGTFKTVLNEPFSELKYAQWDPRTPRVATEHCISMNKRGMLDDYPCEIPGFFICEQPSINATTSNLKPGTQYSCTEDSNTNREPNNLKLVINCKQDPVEEENIDIRSSI